MKRFFVALFSFLFTTAVFSGGRFLLYDPQKLMYLNISEIQNRSSGGDVYADYLLGIIYYYGLPGEKQNFRKAKKNFLKASANSVHQADYYLGYMHYNKIGFLFTNKKKAKYYYEKAVKGGIAEAKYYLSLLLLEEKNDLSQVLFLMKEAADDGLVEANVFLGDFYSSGTYVDSDEKESLSWYLKAALLGDNESQNKIAYAYLRGLFSVRDEINACAWAFVSNSDLQLLNNCNFLLNEENFQKSMLISKEILTSVEQNFLEGTVIELTNMKVKK